MAHTDPLTGLANERTVGRILELEIARAGRQGGEVSFAIFDVDDFQATNRESGNDAGDDVLRQVASVLAESVRPGRHGRPDRWRRVRARRARVGRDDGRPADPRRDRGAAAGRLDDRSRCRPGSPASRADAGDVEALIAAAKDGLEKARAEGRGTVAPGIAPAG